MNNKEKGKKKEVELPRISKLLICHLHKYI